MVLKARGMLSMRRLTRICGLLFTMCATAMLLFCVGDITVAVVVGTAAVLMLFTKADDSANVGDDRPEDPVADLLGNRVADAVKNPRRDPSFNHPNKPYR